MEMFLWKFSGFRRKKHISIGQEKDKLVTYLCVLAGILVVCQQILINLYLKCSQVNSFKNGIG